jgi:hypothetical protein
MVRAGTRKAQQTGYRHKCAKAELNLARKGAIELPEVSERFREAEEISNCNQLIIKDLNRIVENIFHRGFACSTGRLETGSNLPTTWQGDSFAFPTAVGSLWERRNGGKTLRTAYLHYYQLLT